MRIACLGLSVASRIDRSGIDHRYAWRYDALKENKQNIIF